ncbi:hypothetical protein D3C79_793390 [compost metagenome]
MYANHGFQVGAFAFVEVLQVRQGLEVVGIQTLLVDLYVWLHIVGEHLDLQVHAFFGQGRFDQLKNFGVGYRGGGNHQFFASLGKTCNRQSGRQSSQQQSLFHAQSLFEYTAIGRRRR